MGSGPFLLAWDLGVLMALLTRHSHERGQQCCIRMDLKSTLFWTKAAFVWTSVRPRLWHIMRQTIPGEGGVVSYNRTRPPKMKPTESSLN